MKPTDKYLLTAVKAALEAGSEILRIYNDPRQDFAVEKKSDDSPLTKADRAAHNAIAARLESTPYPILSEEGKEISYDERSGWETLWIVDPLDGTKEFIKKNGEFTVNIALVTTGRPVMGIIYVPVTGELYFAEESIGAYKTASLCPDSVPQTVDALTAISEKLQTTSTLTDKYTVVVSRSHLDENTQNYINEKRIQYPDLEFVPSGSSIKICLVAEGKADVYPRFAPTMEWDTAAGDAIASIAGRSMIDPETGSALRYNKENLLNPWFIVTGKDRMAK